MSFLLSWLCACPCPTHVCEYSEKELYLRARQLFYYLKGGQIDYGEEHSKARGHIQFGRIYERGSKISIIMPCNN